MVSVKHLTLLALAQLSVALPGGAASPFGVTDLDIFSPTGRPGDTQPYTVSFGVSDPNDGSATTCSVSWPYEPTGAGYPANYVAGCADPAYEFKFVDFVRFYDFKLDVKHKKPGPKKTLHGKGQVVDRGNVRCTFASSGFSRCTQITDFPLPIYKKT